MSVGRSLPSRWCEAAAVFSLACFLGACSSERSGSLESNAQGSLAETAEAPRQLAAKFSRFDAAQALHLERRAVNDAMVMKSNALAQRLREEAVASKHAAARGFFFSPNGDITDEFEPVLQARSGTKNGPSEPCGHGNNWSGYTLLANPGVPPARVTSQTAGFAFLEDPGPDQQQHVEYVGEDQHVYELVFTPGHSTEWSGRDLTKLTAGSGPLPLAKDQIIGFQTTLDHQQHLMYVGALDNDIHELRYDGSWHHRDLTSDTQSVQPDPYTRFLSGYQTTFNKQAHVDYISHDGDVRELFFDGSDWQPVDLSASARAVDANTPVALANGGLVGYQTASNSQQHVDFITVSETGAHVNELVHGSDNQWRWNDLTLAAANVDDGAPNALWSTALVGYQTTDNRQHVDFIDAGSNHLYELSYESDNRWHPKDLTDAASAAPPNPSSPLAGYQTTYNGQQHLDFIDASGKLEELYSDGSNWFSTNVSQQSGLDDIGVTPGLVALDGYQTTSPVNQQQIEIVATDSEHAGHVFEAYINQGQSSWNPAVDLTATSSVPWQTVTATWQVPRVSQPLQASDSLPTNISTVDDGWNTVTWIGLDGYGASADVLQSGTRQTLLDNAARDTQYVPWVEWYPDDEQDIFIAPGVPMPEVPGDTFTVTISYQGGGGFIVLNNVTAGIGVSTPMAAPDGADGNGRTVEWIMETPCEHHAGTDNLAALPAFTPVNFTHATATDGAGTVGDPSTSTLESEIVRTDFFGNRIPLTKATLPGPQQVSVEFVDWYDNDLSKIAGAPAVFGRLVAFSMTQNNQQHVLYVGNDFSVYDLFFPNSKNTWGVQNLTSLTHSPAVAPGSDITGYQVSSSNQAHVDFVSSEGHLREFWYDTSWHAGDLTLSATACDGTTPLAVTTSPLAGYQTTFNSQQHVDFIDQTKHHLYELWYGTRWCPADLTAAARSQNSATPDPFLQTTLDGYATSFSSQNQQHVNFVSTDTHGVSHVNELWYDNAWHWNDLTAATASPTPLQGTPLNGYATTFNGQQHVNFVGPSDQVFELYYLSNCTPTATKTCWQFNNVSSQAGISIQASLQALAGYQTTFNNQEHVDYISQDDGHVRELYFADQGWHARDLTTATVPQAKTVSAASRLTGYQTSRVQQPPGIVVDKQEHVDYVSVDDLHVHELIHGP